jgi:hypothetical protein
MSVVGEAIAIVSCVAGLIQAYDAAARRIEQIKIRKAQRQAPPLPVRLETSVERGRQQIADALEEGKERFGEEFEHEYDSMPSGQWSKAALTMNRGGADSAHANNDSNAE